MSAKIYLQTLPLCEVISKIQEHIDGSEDTEIRLSVELEKTSNNPAPVSSCLWVVTVISEKCVKSAWTLHRTRWWLGRFQFLMRSLRKPLNPASLHSISIRIEIWPTNMKADADALMILDHANGVTFITDGLIRKVKAHDFKIHDGHERTRLRRRRFDRYRYL